MKSHFLHYHPWPILIILLLNSSCSSLNTTLVYGGAGGAAVGAIAGHTLSPDRESDAFNTVVWGLVGGVVGAGISYLLRADDPDNQEMKQMLRKDALSINNPPLVEDFGFQLIPPSDSKSFVVPDQTIPERLKGRVKKQIVTEHIVQERIEKKEGGKTIVYPETKVYEYDFE